MYGNSIRRALLRPTGAGRILAHVGATTTTTTTVVAATAAVAAAASASPAASSSSSSSSPSSFISATISAAAVCGTIATTPLLAQARRACATATTTSGGGGGGGGGTSGDTPSAFPADVPDASLHHQPRGSDLHNNSSSNHKRRSFQPFTDKDENDLVSVMSSQPRHVLRHVRQSIWRGRKRELHFRATVTHLMIVLQEFLRKQQIDPAGAAVILEGTMEECVRLSQHDMAHLLFRAFLRFRKYGVVVSPKCIHALYSSFRDAIWRNMRSAWYSLRP